MHLCVQKCQKHHFHCLQMHAYLSQSFASCPGFVELLKELVPLQLELLQRGQSFRGLATLALLHQVQQLEVVGPIAGEALLDLVSCTGRGQISKLMLNYLFF